MGSPRARRLRGALIRLLWLVSWPDRGLAGMPWGWAHGRFGERVVLPMPVDGVIDRHLRDFAAGVPGPLSEFLQDRLQSVESPFEWTVIAEDLEKLAGRPARSAT